MKAASSPSTFAAVITVLVMSYGHLLTAWAHQEDSVNVASSAQFFDAATTTRRDFLVSEPEERILGKKAPSPPPPTGPSPPGPTGPSPPGPTGPSPPGPTPLTASPTLSLRPTFKPVPLDACAAFTREPTTPPTPSPTQACTNPGQCSTKTGCCPGFSCRKVKNVSSCVQNRRHLREGSKVPFETTTEERRLGNCDGLPDQCNVFGNPLQCNPPVDRPVSIICNYGGDYPVYVKPCMESMTICCEDGGGGYYGPAPCWGGNERQCCAKGYTNTNNGCLARDCCDESDTNRNMFCSSC